MIILAFNRVLSEEARHRLQKQFEDAKRDNKIIVVEECMVLSDDAPELVPVKFADGSAAFIPNGLTRQAVIEALRNDNDNT